MIAILPTLGFQEILVLMVLGILLFGRNLPDVGRKVGRTVAQLRRGMQEFKDQMNRDETVRGLRDSVKNTRDELRRAGAVPRVLANPGAAVRDAAKTMLDQATADGDPAAAPDSGAQPSSQQGLRPGSRPGDQPSNPPSDPSPSTADPELGDRPSGS